MKSYVALFALSFAAVSAFAQLNPLPPSSTVDGILVQSGASSPSQANWTASALFGYRTGANAFSTPTAGNVDVYGHTWSASAPSFSGLSSNGGTLRAIFLGGFSQAVQGFGYSLSGSPAAPASFTLAGSGSAVDPMGLAFGDWADLPLAIHDLDTFDFWLATGAGAYTVRSPGHSLTSPTQHTEVLWTQAPLLVSTFIPALGTDADVQTWVVSVVEYSADLQSHTEFRFALQEFERSGHALALDQSTTPVPEPSTYAMLGALACGVIAIRRRLRHC